MHCLGVPPITRRSCGLSLGVVVNWGSPCSAHATGLQAGDAWWLAWHCDSLVLFNVTLLAILYGRGVARAWLRAGFGRSVSGWQVTSFVASLVLILLALLSPLDALGNDLAWVHMLQHMTLMVAAAPLLALSGPGLAMAWAMPGILRGWRRSWLARKLLGLRAALQRMGWHPLFIWWLHAAVLWLWHVPSAYQLALQDQLVHDLEHLSFFAIAFLFWRLVLDPRRIPTLNPGWSIVYLFTTSLHAMVLGVLMALAPRVWYPVYIGRTEGWGLTALEDQQLAGLIMWMPACLVYAVVAVALFAQWLQRLESIECRPYRANKERPFSV
jgi:putative membrane protein